MLTRCGICGCALDLEGDDSSALCQECWVQNFAGQKIPDLDVPHITVVGLAPRRRLAGERLRERHREEADGAG